MMDFRGSDGQSNAWQPGITSDVPPSLKPLITVFRAEHSTVPFKDATELADFSGLDVHGLATFRVERLITHDLLVRVTADLSVPDGPNYEELGINLRTMVATINDRYVAPHMNEIRATFDAELLNAERIILEEIECRLFARQITTPIESGDSLFAKFLNRVLEKKPKQREFSNPPTTLPDGSTAIDIWHTESSSTDDDLYRSCCLALVKVIGGIARHRGRVPSDKELMVKLVKNQVSNQYGAQFVSQLIAPYIDNAITAEGYRRLPSQDKPVIMNVKGASAAGKSTIRPQQRQLAEKLGIPWEDFALISPDYWRKYLLDYESLGDDYRYGAMLTGQELEIVDKKLDRYMAEKASKKQMPHLLIDRFRFDSFVLNKDRSEDSKLLTRFGDRIFMFFMVTPPEETVTRAWHRGLKTGRFKAVDDLLYHNVEAFTGMPALFFSWISSGDKKVHFEFLDNDVKEGNLPNTVAFGWNNCMTILDIHLMMNIDRYRKVNVNAKTPEDVFASKDLEPIKNTSFIKHCCEKIAQINYADKSTAEIYARTKNGKLIWWNKDYIDQFAEDSELQVAMRCLGYNGNSVGVGIDTDPPVIDVTQEKHYTFGYWGEVAH